VTCTTWPAALLLHFRNRQLGNAEESGEVDAERAGEIGLAIFGERFGDEDAGVVDQRVDTAESGQAVGNHALGGSGIGDVAGHRQDVVVVRRLD